MASEKSPKLVTPERLFAELSSFALERNRAFKMGETDIFTESVQTATRVELIDDEADTVAAAYDEETIRLTAERIDSGRTQRLAPPSDFSIEHVIVRQLEAVPGHLRHLVDAELIEQYDMTEPGDLNEKHQVTYQVVRDYDGELTIVRDTSYELRDIEDTVYEVHEDDEADGMPVSVAQEGHTLYVAPAITQEQIADIGLRVQTGIAFDELLDSEWRDVFDSMDDLREIQSIVAIRALMHALKTGKSLPKNFDI